MYDARQIANWFVRRAEQDGRNLSIMQLLKLIYISHGWYMEMSNAPLIRNKIEAWKYGPVIPDVYNSFRSQGIQIKEVVPSYPCDVDRYAEHVLEQIYKSHGWLSAIDLSNITHERGGPWDVASRTRGYFAPISNEAILSHYKAVRKAHAGSHDG